MQGNKKVVVIGGGTGTFTVLTGLREHPVELSAVVSMADNGGSTGLLRDELGVLPPGDIRQCLAALSESPQVLRELFMYRFEDGSLAGHNFGNLFLSALQKIKGNFEDAIEEAGKILAVRGKVIPVTCEDMNLCAELENGQMIFGETLIDEPRATSHLKIKRISLKPEVRAAFSAISAIESADAIVLGPGDLFTSVLPNLLVRGIREAILRSAGKRIYICNIMTKLGQTNNYPASQFVREVETYLGRGILDFVLLNTEEPPKEYLNFYSSKEQEFVAPDIQKIKAMGYKALAQDLLSRSAFQKSSADKLQRSLIRHDSQKLAKIILNIL